MILNHQQIAGRLIRDAIVEGASHECINAASLDIRLGQYVFIELPPEDHTPVALAYRDPLNFKKVDLKARQGKIVLKPGQFILAQSYEIFHLPADISAEYKLKSSMARMGIEHLNAGWCDAGWHGSVLTLELKNMTQFHDIELNYLDKIGQMIFYQHDAVLTSHSYATKGTYNGDKEVSHAKPNLTESSNSSINSTELSRQAIDSIQSSRIAKI